MRFPARFEAFFLNFAPCLGAAHDSKRPPAGGLLRDPRHLYPRKTMRCPARPAASPFTPCLCGSVVNISLLSFSSGVSAVNCSVAPLPPGASVVRAASLT